MLKLIGKRIFAILHRNFCLSKPVMESIKMSWIIAGICYNIMSGSPHLSPLAVEGFPRFLSPHNL